MATESRKPVAEDGLEGATASGPTYMDMRIKRGKEAGDRSELSKAPGAGLVRAVLRLQDYRGCRRNRVLPSRISTRHRYLFFLEELQ